MGTIVGDSFGVSEGALCRLYGIKTIRMQNRGTIWVLRSFTLNEAAVPSLCGPWRILTELTKHWFWNLGKGAAMIVVYSADVGSVREGNFGWAKVYSDGGEIAVQGSRSIDLLVDHLAYDLKRKDCSVALGMECPLYIPVPSESHGIGTGREGEHLSCLSKNGGFPAIQGIHQLSFILGKILVKLGKANPPGVTLDHFNWMPYEENGKQFLVWEACVGGNAHFEKGHVEEHIRDAATAAADFWRRLELDADKPSLVLSDVSVLGASFSLAGAALLWAGWVQDLSLLTQEVFVVRPESPFRGRVVQAQPKQTVIKRPSPNKPILG